MPVSPPVNAVFNMMVSLTRVYMRRELTKKERLEFLAEVTDDLRWQVDAPNVVHIRPREHSAAAAKSREEALSLWEVVAERLAAELTR